MRKHTTHERIERLMHQLGSSVTSEGRVYFTGGVSAVLLGWREMTLDVDLKPDPEAAGFFESLRRLKDELDINIELASPDQFVPPLAGWRERSQFIAQHGRLAFYHYDFYGQALAKIERAHVRGKDAAIRARSSVEVSRTLYCGRAAHDSLSCAGSGRIEGADLGNCDERRLAIEFALKCDQISPPRLPAFPGRI